MIDRSKILHIEMRFFEIVPAFLTWAILLAPFLLSFYLPRGVAIFVILFDIYWLLRSIRLNIDLLQSYRHLRSSLHIQWHEKLRTDYSDKKLPWHVFLFPYYNEDIDILRASIESLLYQKYPLEKVLVVLAVEERGGDQIRKNAEILCQEFKEKLGGMFMYIHPGNISGEVKGKGPNITFAVQSFEKELPRLAIDLNDVLISSIDTDAKLHPEHCASFTYAYFKNDKNPNTIYQFIPMYHNNIWDTHALMRVVATSSSFWLMMEANNPEKLKTFACYGMCLSTLKKADYWDKTSIIEDGVQYWRNLVAFDGDHKVVPIFIPVYQDAVLNEGYFRTYVGQYVQLRRWAWGASDFALIMPEFLRNKRIPVSIKISETARLLGSHIPRATAPLLLFVSGWFPLLNVEFRDTVLAFNLPIITSNLLTLSMLGISTALVLSIMLLPSPRKPYPFWKRSMHAIQWVFAPFVTIIFGAIPAIDAQTRLAFGKRLEFVVTEKKR